MCGSRHKTPVRQECGAEVGNEGRSGQRGNRGGWYSKLSIPFSVTALSVQNIENIIRWARLKTLLKRNQAYFRILNHGTAMFACSFIPVPAHSFTDYLILNLSPHRQCGEMLHYTEDMAKIKSSSMSSAW
jgi:hypothetical protein